MTDFDDFWAGNLERGWKRYPRRAKRPVTEKAYWEAREKATHEEIMEGLQAALREEYMDRIRAGQIAYIPHSYNWLKNEQWLDHLGEPIQEGLTQEQIERWQQRLDNGEAVPEGIKKLLPADNVVRFREP